MIFDRFVKNTEETIKQDLFPEERLSDEQYIEWLLDSARHTHGLCEENIAMLQTEILPLLDSIESQPREVVDELFLFARALLAHSKRLDREISFRTHQALLRYARVHEDETLLIRQLYYCGLGYYNFMSDKLTTTTEPDGEKAYRNEYFFEAAGFIANWQEISDAETMDYIVRSCANRMLGYNSTGTIEVHSALCTEALEIVSRPALREKFPSLPWEQYEMTIHQNRTAVLGIVRLGGVDPQIILQVKNSAEYILAHQQKAAPRWVYTLWASRYHLGEVSLDELLELLRTLYNGRQRGRYEADLIWENVTLPMLYLFYCNPKPDTVSAEQAKELKKRRDADEEEILQALFTFCHNFSGVGYDASLIWAICRSFTVLSTLHKITLKDALMQLVMQRHCATYIHSEMVATIASFIADAILEKEPLRFAGLLKTDDAAEIHARRGEVLDLVRSAGLLHDLGKLMCLETVAVNNRRLFASEMEIIRTHPLSSYLVLKQDDSTRLFAQCALMHHFAYDGSFGYPELPKDFQRDPALDILTDLVTVADSMDAATDFIGRSYARAASFDKLMGEYQEGYDTRYAGYVIDYLADEKLREKLTAFLDEGRKALYIASYHRFNKQSAG